MTNSSSWVEEIKAIRSEGSFEKAITFLNQILTRSPEDPVVHYQIAWTHDALGKESDAAPAYEKAISLGLKGEDLEAAYVGLGSTYRCLGQYNKSKEVLERGLALFPHNGALKVFLAITLHNLRSHNESVEILLKELVTSSSDQFIQRYQKAFLFYSDKLDKTFD